MALMSILMEKDLDKYHGNALLYTPRKKRLKQQNDRKRGNAKNGNLIVTN